MTKQDGQSLKGTASDGARGRRAPFLGLRLQLLLLCLALLVPALVTGGLTAWQLGNAYREATENGLRGTARAMAAAVDQQIAAATTAATTLATSLRRIPYDEEDLTNFHPQARVVGDAFGGWVLLARSDGTQLLNTLLPPGTTLPQARGLPWIRQALESGQPVVSGRSFIGGVSQRPIISVFVPLRPEGPPTVLILSFDAARLSLLLGRVRDGQVAGLIDRESGRLIARSAGHAETVGHMAPGWMRDAILLNDDSVAQGLSMDDLGVVAAFHRLEGTGWAAYVTTPLSTYDAAWQAPTLRLAAGAAALLAAAILLAGWRARRLLSPLEALTREAEAMAAGRAEPPRTGPFAVGEFETLRRALSQSSGAMRARAMAEGRAVAALEMMAALRNERDRAQLYFDAAGTVLLVLNPDATVQSINRRGLETLGLTDEAEVLSQDWFSTFVSARWQARARVAFQSVVEGAADAPEPEVNPVLRADGEERLIAWRSTALRDADGTFIALLCSGEDITERRATEERQVLLMQEVDHRAKNALALVQSIIRLTRADHPADFADAVEGRVGALARAYTALARERWAGSDLRELAEAELAAYMSGERVVLSGPSVRLAPEVVQPMSMVLYELAANAAQHGALSAPEGQVSLHWERAPDGALRFEWRERGGPALPGGQPARRGFGSRMIKVAVAGQLGGTIAFDWRPTGLACTLTVAPDRVAIRQARPTSAPPAARTIPRAGTAEGVEGVRHLLRGRRVLLAEDEVLVALELAQTLEELGCQVAGPASTLAEALQIAEREPLDLAVLDVNLRGQAAFPVADLLVRAGVPVLFVTGYGEMPGGWAVGGGQGRTALLRKPLAQGALGGALGRLLGDDPPRPAGTLQPRVGGALPPSRGLRQGV